MTMTWPITGVLRVAKSEACASTVNGLRHVLLTAFAREDGVNSLSQSDNSISTGKIGSLMPHNRSHFAMFDRCDIFLSDDNSHLIIEYRLLLLGYFLKSLVSLGMISLLYAVYLYPSGKALLLLPAFTVAICGIALAGIVRFRWWLLEISTSQQ
jgi:hypothetical protein